MTELRTGDIVVCKAGGPLMSVVGIEKCQTVACAWYSPTADNFRQVTFSVGALVRVASRENAEQAKGAEQNNELAKA